jgi:hypothetical protein
MEERLGEPLRSADLCIVNEVFGYGPSPDN